MTLHPQIIEKEGKKEFVILPYEEFLKLKKALEDFDDLKELRKEKEASKDQPTIPLAEVAKQLKF